jgi:CpeT/CpcT family protein DUF1001
MVALLALGMAAAAAADAGDVAVLERVWSGVRDSSEQTVVMAERGAAAWQESSDLRVRTVVAPVSVPFLGAHVLYLEEFVQDEPQQPRRQLLLQLEPLPEREHTVRVRLYTFTSPARWTHLNYRPALISALGPGDIVAATGCDMLLTRVGEQFRGGTAGRHCVDRSGAVARYLDYQLLVGEDLYWYRRRILRQSDAELQQEVIGFNRFQPNEARLYACRIDWSASGRARDLHQLLTLDLHEAGGRARFVTPDGRALELTLHGRDWPFAVDRDALLLSLQEPGSDSPLATAWAQMDAQQITLTLEWLQVRCGSIAPDSDELAQ